MAINFISEDYQFSLPQKKIVKNWLRNVITSNSKQVGDINFIFCSEEYILKINKQYLKHNYLTDIITFPYSESETISADIFICIPVIMSNAKTFNQEFIVELRRVLVHGILHMVGFSDYTEQDKDQMTQQEDYWLSKY